MSTLSPKEKRFLLIGVTVLLYGIAAFCYKAQMPNWKKEQRLYQAAEKKLTDERALIAARAQWQEQYEQVNEFMPLFPKEKDMDTYWQRIMDDTAQEVQLTINRRQPVKEIEVGGVCELPIDCKSWEGSLESLVHFLYELSVQDGAMLDVRQLYIKPTNKPGMLSGTFTLYCAFMRGN